MSSQTLFNAQVITASGNEVGSHVVTTNSIAIQVEVSAVSGTSPSATLSVLWSDDGVTFSPASPADAFAAFTAVGSVAEAFSVKGQMFRLAWVVSGTTPSFTVSALSYS